MANARPEWSMVIRPVMPDDVHIQVIKAPAEMDTLGCKVLLGAVVHHAARAKDWLFFRSAWFSAICSWMEWEPDFIRHLVATADTSQHFPSERLLRGGQRRRV
jgi:hypothetical protein